MSEFQRRTNLSMNRQKRKEASPKDLALVTVCIFILYLFLFYLVTERTSPMPGDFLNRKDRRVLPLCSSL